MCRNTISVAWDGSLYDCDFNQMLDLPARSGRRAGPSTSATSTRAASRRGAIVTAPALLRLHGRRRQLLRRRDDAPSKDVAGSPVHSKGMFTR